MARSISLGVDMLLYLLESVGFLEIRHQGLLHPIHCLLGGAAKTARQQPE